VSYKGSFTQYGNSVPVSAVAPQGRAECRVSIMERDGSARVTVELRAGVVSTAILTVRTFDLELLADSLREAVRAMQQAQARTIRGAA